MLFYVHIDLSIVLHIINFLPSASFERVSNSRSKSLYRRLISFLLSSICGFHVVYIECRVTDNIFCRKMRIIEKNSRAFTASECEYDVGTFSSIAFCSPLIEPRLEKG